MVHMPKATHTYALRDTMITRIAIRYEVACRVLQERDVHKVASALLSCFEVLASACLLEKNIMYRAQERP